MCGYAVRFGIDVEEFKKEEQGGNVVENRKYI